MFEVKNLSKQYGTEFALNDVSLHIGRGLNFIVGASGSGKTTLLKILSGMEQGTDGSVRYLGKDIGTFTDREKCALYNSTFGFVWQDFHLLEEATVLENIRLPQYLGGKASSDAADRVLKQLKIESLSGQKVKELSGGQKQRVAIARELMKDPQAIFCDEPTSALDAKATGVTMNILRALAKTRTVIVVTHDTSLIGERDSVFELDKGELVSAPERISGGKAALREMKPPRLTPGNAFKIARTNHKNRLGRFFVSVLSLMLAGTLLLTAVSGAIGESGQAEFEKLVDTYGEGILDISLIGSFMSASGGDENKPSADVDQDLSGLYEEYENDPRVEYIVSAQAFENIEIGVDGQTYTVEKTGSSPVLTKLLAGSIPAGETYQAVIPAKFAEQLGLSPKEAIGTEIDFSATIFQWIDNQPVEKPIRIQATVCGVGDNTAVYDFEGKQYSYTIDDSFFFNRAAIEEIRRQAGIEDGSANFTMHAKTPKDMIDLNDELYRSGIVALGRFELVEDIVRLNTQTAEQSGAAGVLLGVLSVLLGVIVSVMTSVLRRREYAIYRISGYGSSHLAKIAGAESVCTAVAAILLMLITSPLLDKAARALFGASINAQLALGAVLVIGVAAVSFAVGLLPMLKTDVSEMLKAGDR